LVIFGNLRTVNQTESLNVCFVTYRLAERRRRTIRGITSRASSPCTSTARNSLRLWSFEL